MNMQFDDDVKIIINWLASNPQTNSDIFIYLCKDKGIDIDNWVLDDDYLYFYKKGESRGKHAHVISIVGCNIYPYMAEEYLKDWSDTDCDVLPTLFSEDDFIVISREVGLWEMSNILTTIRDVKLNQIL